MIIVSQEKTRIINFDNILQLYINKCEEEIMKYYVRYEDCNNSYEDLGEYKTEERAKEVLQEIIKAYLDCNEQNHLAEFAYVKNKVYEMPEE
nr:MAG TPA: hypothetical protein [Caudoviricetes sp.]